MTNDICQLIEEGLSDLMAPRAARRVLSRALRAEGYRAEQVSASEMQLVLRGPLREQLELLLPGDAVRHRLRQLERQLRCEEREAAAVSEPANAEQAAQELALRASGAALKLATSSRRRVAGQGEDSAVMTLERGAGEVETAEGAATETAQREAREPEKLKADAKLLTQAQLERVALGFAQLEEVRAVMLTDRQGRLLFSRGSGFDFSALARMASLCLRLLGRSGELRAYHLMQAQGQLFLFPFAWAQLFVISGPEVNLGLVFATREKLVKSLKEDV